MRQRREQSADFIEPNIISLKVASDARISSVSVFSDLVWDRREYKESRTQWKGALLHWKPLFAKYGGTHYELLISIMEFAYALLFDPMEEDLQRDTKSVNLCIHNLSAFLDYLQEKHLYNVADLDHADIQAYVKWLLRRRQLSTEKKSDSEQSALTWTALHISAAQLYFRYGKRISQPLLVNPLHGESVFLYLGKKRKKFDGNTTPIIPKNVWDSLLCAALDYVEIYASDILHGQEFLEKIRREVLPSYIKKNPKYRGSNFICGSVNGPLKKIKRDFAVNPRTLEKWRLEWQSASDLRVELQALYHACLVVIGGLSGMRESEIALIDVDGFWQESTADGTRRYVIASRLTKGDSDHRLQWEVNEPVYKACNIVKSLTAYARKHVEYRELFIQGWNMSPSQPILSTVKMTKYGETYGRTSILPVGPNAFTRDLRHFALHLEQAVAAQYRLPKVEGVPWVFVMRMLRRSLAGRIAREPFGMIAGMLHYKHVKITTFIGYAGSDSTWLQELQDEEISANEEFLEQIWEDLQEGALAGAKGEELVKEFKGMAGKIKKNALQYFLESTRANLHIGLLNYCVFQKDRALCLTGVLLPKGDRPILNACHPERCANSCIATKHLPIWESQVSDAQAMLNHSKVTGPQREALSSDLTKALRIVKQLKRIS